MTTVVAALEAVASGEPAALHIAVNALGVALEVLRALAVDDEVGT